MNPTIRPLNWNVGFLVGSSWSILNRVSKARTPAGSLPCRAPKQISRGPLWAPVWRPIRREGLGFGII